MKHDKLRHLINFIRYSLCYVGIEWVSSVSFELFPEG